MARGVSLSALTRADITSIEAVSMQDFCFLHFSTGHGGKSRNPLVPTEKREFHETRCCATRRGIGAQSLSREALLVIAKRVGAWSPRPLRQPQAAPQTVE
jgi:hypothetical protein